MAYQPRRLLTAVVASLVLAGASFASVLRLDTSNALGGVGFALCSFVLGVIPAIFAVASDGSQTVAPRPHAMALFLATVRRTLEARGYASEDRDGAFFAFSNARFLGKRFVIVLYNDAVGVEGPNADVDAVLASIFALHRNVASVSPSIYRGRAN